MPLDRKPTKAGRPWVPDLLFEPVARPQSGASSAGTPSSAEISAELVAAGAAVEDTALQPEGRQTSQAPASSESDDLAELRRILAEQEKALRSLRILRRNLQEDVSKAKRAFMFAERGRLGSIKGVLDDLVAREQQSESDERRLASEILAIRAKLERSQHQR